MNKIQIGQPIRAVGGLNQAIQLCEVFLIQGDNRHFTKGGFEIRLVGKGEDEKRQRPRSFYVNEKEIPKLDKLIKCLIKLRWQLWRINKNYDPEFIPDLTEYHREEYQNSMIEGLRS